MQKQIFALFSLLILYTFLSISAYSQEMEMSNTDNSNWKTYNKIDGVEINFKYIECNKPSQGTFKEYIVFQFVNTNSTKVEVSYSQLLWYDEEQKTFGDKEYQRQLRLDPNQTIETTCDSYLEYNIFSKFLNYNKAELTKFELSEMKITNKK